MIQLRHRQPSLWHSGLAKDIEDLWEPWMKEVDQLLEDAALVESVYEAQGKRHRKSRTHGRTQTPAEVALRLLILKHVRNWSYDTLEREVRANLVYRAFTRIGDEKVPDAKTLARLGQVIGPEVIGELQGKSGKKREKERERGERYRELVSLTRKIVHQAEGVLQEMQHLPRRRQTQLKRLREILETMTGRVRQVVRQTKARVFQGITKYPHKIVSLFEPHTEIIRKGKASKPNEFGNLVKVQEAENQIITHYEVFAERPEDSHLLVSAVEQHQRRFGRVPRMVAADTGFYSLKNEKSIQGMGVTRVAVPSRSSKSSERRKLQKTRWFRAGQRWRTGCEGRISVLKRRHGLNRCRYRGFEGMRRWVGLGVIADNIIQIGRCLALRRA